MNSDYGYLHLNIDNAWPTFDLADIEIASDGSLRLSQLADGSYATKGVFRGGPFEVINYPTPWYILRVDGSQIPPDVYVQLFTFTADIGDAPYDPTADEPFNNSGWMAAPRNALDLVITNPPGIKLWIGGLVLSDGQDTPTLHQMRVEYGRDTYLKHLPAIYGKESESRDFLERLLSLQESVLSDLESEVSDLPRLFDPFAAPNEGFPSWLSWLAGWLDFDLNETWNEEQTRQYLSQAFDLYTKRGTLEGLKRYLKIYAGVEAHIEEPALHTSLWSLGDVSTLGFTTMLAPAHLQGAVVDTSATTGQSHMVKDDALGTTLFEDLAHHFRVLIYCAELTRIGALDDAKAVIDREKPAHTTYHLCLIEPQMRVGVQARVGIDAIIAQGPQNAQTGMPLNTGVIAAQAEACEQEEEEILI
jgi:phage tail-like protein